MNIEILPELHNACMRGNYENVLQILLENKNNINKKLDNSESL